MTAPSGGRAATESPDTDPDLDDGRRRARRRYAESELRALADTGRYLDAHRVRGRDFAETAARGTPLGPHLAAAAAARAGPAQRNVERDRCAFEGLTRT